MINKITRFSDIAMEISENQYAQTILMSQLGSNFLVDSLDLPVYILVHNLPNFRILYVSLKGRVTL